ncbi:MAG: hypothetical protein ABL904_01690 [Hyphomicrobiaceae bacterium]
MSGPKVVRIVTREEIIATCKDILAQLEVEIRRWEKIGTRNELLNDEEIGATRKRHAALTALLAADRFMDLQKQVPDMIAYLQADTVRRLSEAATNAASVRLQGRRLATMARQTLDRSDIVLPPDLRRDLEAVVAGNGSEKAQAERVLSNVMLLSLRQTSPRALTLEQEAHAKRLSGDDKGLDFQQWLAANSPEPESITVKVEGAIEELRLAGSESLSTRFGERHRSIQDESSKFRRQMLADTLMLEVGKALTDIRLRAEQLSTLEQRAAPLHTLQSAEAKELSGKVAVAVAEQDVASVGRLLTKVAECLAKERKALAAKAQRSAVLSALKDLGYEVREGMETAAPKDGHVVLRRAANPDMGVEITGIHSAERVQIRPVRFGQADTDCDKSKDRAIEAMWCSDFDRLKGKIGAGQGTLKIEQAHEVGAVPVLFVSDGPPPDDRRPEVRTPTRTRTLY